MKIKYQTRPEGDISINVPGNWVVSLKNGGTRVLGKKYKIINNPKTQKPDENFMWYISEKGFPCKIGIKNINTFRKLTPDEEKEVKNL